MNFATIENGQVKNIIVLLDDFDGSEFAGKQVVPANDAAIGDGWDGEKFIKPPEPEPEIIVPQSVTRRQGRLALLQAPHGEVTKLDAVEAALESITDPMQKRAAMIEYDADTWMRNNAFLQAMWAQLGGTESELDDLFRTAATL